MSEDPQQPLDAMLDSLKETWLTTSDLSALRAVQPELLAFVQREVDAHAARVRESERSIYETLAKITRFIPNLVLGRIAGSLSPYSSARVAEFLEPKHAAALAKNYEPAYLSEVSIHLEPSAAARIAVYMDLDSLTRLNEALMQRGLYRRLAELSDALDVRMLAKLAGRMHDPAGIASVASHMRVLDKVVAVGEHLDKRVQQTVREILRTRKEYTLLALLEDGA